ncbi:asparaginase domain-containing protein [Salinisphaera hydrothermalis]|uniref:Asparaginase/glutaminase n=1 Tax=Salinisphaera hydrothermalis (strain C41B8) TaxID=1304275 RepID=A0A084IKA7_SALHC|nr:asparaginase domain-containing protein [Salinisphaera hydrothermalis]KEZ77141.1 asparaginase/glutaminase [Salinisphaera hydrothermalis C41B8]
MDISSRSPFRIMLLATGGTIEKSYDASAGALTLDVPVIDTLLATLDQPDVQVDVRRVMSIDSLDMGEAERAEVVTAARAALAASDVDAVVITHGTDTLAQTAQALATALDTPRLPIVLTGAMRPYRVADSDAAQNVAQALMAARLLTPGVYAAFHGRVIPAGRIVKDYERLTLIESAT